MAKFDSPLQLLQSLSAPMSDLIASVGTSVAEAQEALDRATVETFLRIYSSGDGAYEEFKKLGYQPTWYTLPETTAEIRVALSIAGSASTAIAPSTNGLSSDGLIPTRQIKERLKIYAAPVDGAYTGNYNYDISAAAKVSFKIVPIPPPIAAAGMKLAPDLISSKTTVGKVREQLTSLGISHVFKLPQDADADAVISDDNIVDKQYPAPGGIIPGGASMELTVK